MILNLNNDKIILVYGDNMEIGELNKLRSIIEELINDQLEVLRSTTDEISKIKSQTNLNIFKSFLNSLKDDITVDKLTLLSVNYNREYNKNLSAYNNLKNMSSSSLGMNVNNYYYNAMSYKSVYDILTNFLSYISTLTVSNSNKIISLIEKYNSTEDDKLLKEIYDEKINRRKSLISKFGEDIIEELNILESLEERISRTITQKNKTYPIQKSEFKNVLKDTLLAINDYHFLEYKDSKYYDKNEDKENLNKYKLYLRKYVNIISSVYKNKYAVLNYNGNKVTTDNLISYISLYNLDNNYNEFLSSLNDKKINDKVLTKSEYENEVLFINSCIDALCKDSISKMKEDYILISDSEDDKIDLINKRNQLIESINKMERNDMHANVRK